MVPDFISSNTMATVVVGTGQLLELLAKAGGSPAALIYKAGTDLYDYYKSSNSSSPAKNTLQTAEEIHRKRPMLFFTVRQIMFFLFLCHCDQCEV
jgi:hypothetical protein